MPLRILLAIFQLDRHNRLYDFLVKVCELAFNSLLPDPAGKGFLFQDVRRDESKMARVFQDFVRNFYALEQQKFAVEPLTIRWDAALLDSNKVGKLPRMHVDAFLRGPQRKIIIDAKYYARSLQTYREAESFHSDNLYQIFSYVKNASGTIQGLETVEGMLIYPQVQHTLDSRYLVQGHRITVAPVDLTQPWPTISGRMLGLLL